VSASAPVLRINGLSVRVMVSSQVRENTDYSPASVKLQSQKRWPRGITWQHAARRWAEEVT
ncbi:hypothetical protein GD428_12005, partial [Escherichia coli]|nr:hypothetical protein [Escherichia coli]